MTAGGPSLESGIFGNTRVFPANEGARKEFGSSDMRSDVRCERLGGRKLNECCAHGKQHPVQVETSLGVRQPIRMEEATHNGAGRRENMNPIVDILWETAQDVIKDAT